MERYRVHRFRDYSLHKLRKDLISGIIVGIIAIPLGMAFVIASGVKPVYGMYTVIIAGTLISLFGGSRFQIGGPTGAFIPVLLAIVLTYGYENLLLAGLLAGAILLIMGLLRLGFLVQYIPRPVIIGFTTGIAVIIFTSQLTNFFGLSGVQSQVHFIDNMREIISHLPTTNLYSVLTACICLLILLVLPRYLPRIPAALVGIVVSSLVAVLAFPDQVATIGSTYGAIEAALPTFAVPEITLEKLRVLLVPALTIAMLGGIESLLSAVVADGMSGDRHNSNRELIGQGLANIVTPLFGGIPATGAIARTAANIKSGAVSPVSGVVHSLAVLLILLVLAPLASAVPLASMAPVLMVVAWNMSEYKRFSYILKMKSQDALIMLTAFVLTVFVDLMVGVAAGITLAFILFIRNMGKTIAISSVIPSITTEDEQGRPTNDGEPTLYPNIRVISLEGVLFFGSAQVLEQRLQEAMEKPGRIVLLRMNKVPFIDISCVSYFSGVVQHIQRSGKRIIVSELRSQPRSIMISSGMDALVGRDRIFPDVGTALAHAIELDQQLTEEHSDDPQHGDSGEEEVAAARSDIRRWTLPLG